MIIIKIIDKYYYNKFKELKEENKELRKILNIIIEHQQMSLDQARNYLVEKKNFKYYLNEFKKIIIDYED